MALFRKSGRVVYYAHPRKTAGSSFISMAVRAGWQAQWWYEPGRVIDQPTHWTAVEYAPKLVEAGVAPDRYLVTVRHPLRRMGSLYRYNAKIGPRRGEDVPSYDWWINLLMDLNDIRVTPQVEYLPHPHPQRPDVTVLRFEDHPTPPAHYMSALDPGVAVPTVRRESGLSMPTLALPKTTRARLVDYMGADFYAFGYDD